MDAETLKLPFAHTLDSVFERHIKIEALAPTLVRNRDYLEKLATKVAGFNLQVHNDIKISGSQFLAWLDTENPPDKRYIVLALLATHHPLIEQGINDKEKRLKVFDVLENEINKINIQRARHLIGYQGAHPVSSAKQIEKCNNRINSLREFQDELFERITPSTGIEAK